MNNPKNLMELESCERHTMTERVPACILERLTGENPNKQAMTQAFHITTHILYSLLDIVDTHYSKSLPAAGRCCEGNIVFLQH